MKNGCSDGGGDGGGGDGGGDGGGGDGGGNGGGDGGGGEGGLGGAVGGSEERWTPLRVTLLSTPTTWISKERVPQARCDSLRSKRVSKS